MSIFCQDKKLNISSAYLKPGFAFGGSCLPKDLRALSYHGRIHDLQLPILNSVLPSNEMQIARGVKLVIDSGNLRIGILGFSFKAGTDDLRESPVIEVIELVNISPVTDETKMFPAAVAVSPAELLKSTLIIWE